MTNYPNTTIPNNQYPIANATASNSAFVDVYSTRDPTSSDNLYPIQKKWFNTSSGAYWILKGFSTSSGNLYAIWEKIASTLNVESLQGNTGGAVPPNSSNTINVLGDGTYITTSGNPGTSTLTIQTAGGLTTLYTEDSGTAAASSGNLNVTGASTGLTTLGSGNTISLTGTLNVPHGGTGANSFTAHSVLIGEGTSPVSSSSAVSTHALLMGTTGFDPNWTTTGTPYVSGISFDAGSNVLMNFIDTTNFTPVIAGSTSAGTATYAEQSGKYTRFGNWLFYNINLQWSSHTGTGNMLVTGFPTVFAAAQSFYPAVCMMQNVAFPMGTNWVVVDGVNNTTQAEVVASIDSGAFTQVSMSAAGSLHVSGFYPVT